LGINTGIGDVHNLVWKVHATENGWTNGDMLDTYEAERIPIAVANSRQSRENESKIHALGRAVFGTSDKTVEERMRDPTSRKEIENAVRDNQDHFVSLDLQIGFVYHQPRPEGKSVRDFIPQRVPGGRLPHAWIKLQGRIISTLDLVDGHDFVLFASRGFFEGSVVKFGEVNIRVVQIGKDIVDDEGKWSKLMSLDGSPAAVLVRPDQHILAIAESMDRVLLSLHNYLNL
jgi:2,4-dichlorophenol 6-monooxygenase